jgi:nucleotide-binding universal stress UspA family protein
MPTILVPSDFSKNASSALLFAIQLCDQTNHDLIVFHCSHISAYALSAASSEEQMAQLLKEDEYNKMEKLQKQVHEAYHYLHRSEVPASTKCIVSYNQLVVEKTLQVADEFKVSYIIMGTHGATGITKFFFGSNTSIMISKSSIPVLAIPENYSYITVENILFTSDLQNLSNELGRLIPFAQANNSNITILHFDYGLEPCESKIKVAEEVINRAIYKKITLKIEKAVIEKSLVSQIRNYAAIHKPQCLVMFTRERSLWDRLFFKGSKTEDMSTSLNIPLLSYKKT